MKRRVFLLCVLAAVFLLPASPLAEPELSVCELFACTPDRWTDSFDTLAGGKVAVDCAVEVPRALKAPVLSVTWYPALSSAYGDAYAPQRSAWPMNAAHSDDSYTMLTHNYHYALRESEINLKYRDEERFIRLEDVDWDAVYVRNSAMTAGEAFDVLHEAIRDIYSQFGAYGFYDFRPVRGLTVLTLVNQRGEPVREQDVYSFCGQQIIRDLPVLTNAGYTFASSSVGPDTAYRHEGGREAQYYILHVESENSYGFAAHLFAEKGVLAEDIPLCSFDDVKPGIAALIEAGCIREVYGVQFGYAAYPDKQHDLEHYILFPSWVVECEYYDSPDMATEPVNVPNYTNSLHYRRLVVNAQTGRLLDPASKGPDRSDAPQIILWEDVQR